MLKNQSQNIFNKFTTHYKKSIVTAYNMSLAVKNNKVEIEYLLWAILNQYGSLGRETLIKAGIKKNKINFNIETDKLDIEKLLTQKQNLNLSTASKKVIVKSVAMAAKYEHNYIGTEHLLYSLIKINNNKINKILLQHKINPEHLLKNIEIILNSTAKFSEMANAINTNKEENIYLGQSQQHQQKTSLLDFFGINLTNEIIQKNINPVIGRDKEIERIIQILCRRDKNNPILLGEPGVGKTAIVEGLAKKILAGDVPDILLNKKIYALDMPLLIAGTSYRGEFEARIKQIIDEVKIDKNIILFIDEIHNIMGAGSITGTMDAANILKPALARGEISCIGATTFDDYKKHIEPDAALSRRLQKIIVNEPTIKEAIEILKGVKTTYEQHHLVNINDTAIEEAVKLSVRYLTEQYLPDKAIDLIDEAASKKRIAQPQTKNVKKITELEKNLTELNEQKKKLIAQGKYNSALRLKSKEIEIINQIYQLEENQLKNKIKKNKKITANNTVTANDIKKIITTTTDINLSNNENINNSIKKLISGLEEKIIGQPEVISTLTQTLKRSVVGLTGGDRPLGSFIFAGPSGVGKTYTAKVLAELIANKYNGLIKIDMSEYGEKFNSSKIIGAPAGYIGYDEGGQLTEKVKRHPYSIILLDEIEKAHPDIFNLFLQILEDGYLTDSKGKKINFKNTIIIMTTNIGLKRYGQANNIGFTESNNEKANNIFKDKLQEWLKPEFLNRIDEILVFKDLGKTELAKIIELELNKLNKNLKEKKLSIKWNKKVIDKLTNHCNRKNMGARIIREVLKIEIENPLAEMILINPKIKKFNIMIENNKFKIKASK